MNALRALLTGTQQLNLALDLQNELEELGDRARQEDTAKRRMSADSEPLDEPLGLQDDVSPSPQPAATAQHLHVMQCTLRGLHDS